MGPGEIRRIERWLATARVALAISALFAIWMDPQSGYSWWAYWLLGIYIIHGTVVMILLRLRKQSTVSFRSVVHAVDVVWPALIFVFAKGEQNPFFLFFVFVLAAAAYRWGLWETVATATASVILLWLESLAVHLGMVSWLHDLLLRHHLPQLEINVDELVPNHLFMRSVYLLVMGALLGYLAEQQKKLRAEKAVVARMLAGVRIDAGLSSTIEQFLREILPMYAAQSALLASQEANSSRVFLGEVRTAGGTLLPISWLESSPKERDTYLYVSEADTCYAIRKAEAWEVLALDHAGVRLRNLPADFLDRLAKTHSFQSLATVSFVFGQEWAGRIFLFDSALTGDREEELRFLQELIRQIGPAAYNVFLLRRLRLRAGAVERARFARELHDGAVQSLIAVEMQVDVLRRQSASQAASVPQELGRIQGLLREEVLKLRELMQQMKSLDVDAKKLLAFLTDAVERFQRETGISARFVSGPALVDMPPRVCREVARIVQEGLVNVRKHSGASHVLVQFDRRDGHWRLTVEDDGHGFPFSGRFSQAQLEADGRGPMVIKERVRLIDGELTIESIPGRGSRLEITIPQKREAAYG